MTNPAVYINATSGRVEYYTPSKIIEAARATMGSIDLDPASSELANKSVKASVYFTAEQDGLSQRWNGNVWMNHPFSRDGNKQWISKLIHEFKEQRVIQACCITFAGTSESWFRPLMNYPQCYLSPRTNYLLPDGTVFRGVTKGSVVTYLSQSPWRRELFYLNFMPLGSVMMPYSEAA